MKWQEDYLKSQKNNILDHQSIVDKDGITISTHQKRGIRFINEEASGNRPRTKLYWI